MDNAFMTYSLLMEEVKRWQSERGFFWVDRLSSVRVPPYYPINELPEMAVLELCQRLNQVSNTIVSESILRETWDKFKGLRLVTNKVLLSHLQFSLCGVARLFRERVFEAKKGSGNCVIQEYSDVASDKTMECPVCGELAGVSLLSPPNGQRYLHCSICGHEWQAKRVGCIRCGSKEASKLHYLKSEEYPGVEMIVCLACGQYSKEFDLRVKNQEDIDWENIRTLALDYACEKWLAEHAQLSGKVQ